MISCIHVEKAFDKYQYPFLIKIKGNFLKLIMTHKNPTIKTILFEKLNIFFPEIRKEYKQSLLLFYSILKVLSRAINGSKKQSKRFTDWKGRSKNFLYSQGEMEKNTIIIE
jgi:hypothetical protein